MKTKRRVLAIGAHPDDVEYGCGGALLRASQAGHEVHLLVLTCGLSEEEAIIRRKEQEKSAAFLKAELHWGGWQDTSLVYARPLINTVEYFIAKVRPDTILVNAVNDSHQDHVALAKSAIAAGRYVKNFLHYHDYTSLEFHGSLFVDIGNTLEEKAKLLGIHASQVGKDSPAGLDMLESIRALASYYGFLAKVKYAEAFYPLRYLLQVETLRHE